ncbi:GH32 C-terminal domain-containing protein [Paenibacillus alkaliterrae]|uniref:GH32 C-terminal domain-containing protein n=1 Tax=Paenibacillus alkaliterrae TaxID=320909 RepID=UPI001F1B7784|nr:GH32 C-terminal domain-containing protein [Paenibacillus alkaliterrae]MCF2939665.1 GH32 C-terminal domain-containing protein [Paenibacillus alkaliterrae]
MSLNKLWVALLSVVLIWSLLLPASPGDRAYAADTAKVMQGYIPLSGSWTPEGRAAVSGSSGSDANAFLMSTTTAGTNFVYEAEVTVNSASPYDVGSLVFRANAEGTEGYVVNLDPNMDRVRLFDWATNSDVGQPYTTAIEPGVAYHVKIAADGSNLRIYINNQLVIDAQSTSYIGGNVGLHIYNGNVQFSGVDIQETNTNLSGWTTSGGQWTTTSQGWEAIAPENENAYAMASTVADDFTYEANVLIRDQYAVATLLFRSNANGSQAYALQIDPNAGRIRLMDTNGDRELGVSTAELVIGNIYHVRIRAEQSSIKVYWGSGYAPKISVADHTYTSGQAGLQVCNGAAVFQNILAAGFRTNLTGWSATGGTWTPHLEGLKAVSPGSGAAYRVSSGPASDFVLEGDVTIADGGGKAGLLFRSNSNGTAGYIVELDAAASRIRLAKAGDGTELGSAAFTVQAGKSYHLEVAANGSDIDVFADGYASPVLSVQNGEVLSGTVGLGVTNGAAYFQNVYVTERPDYYAELYRPQYHFTQAGGWASDPNGLVYFQGEYHLFHQDGGQWAHVVSTDLVHWKLLPIAIKWNEMGHAWSGSAAADTENKSGLFNGVQGGGLIAYYTSFNPDKWNGNQKIGVAYSSDKGRTWEFHDGNPIIENIGGAGAGWDFRDPKVVWDEEHNQWVMVVSGGDHIRFFKSTNLLDWTAIDSFGYGAYVHNGGVWECPDFFPLYVDGEKKWVLLFSTGARAETNGSDSEYFIGSFDGQRFTSDNPAETVLRYESGRDMYAAMTFADMPDGRRVEIGWMSNWDYPFSFPTSPWKGQMSVPRELKLKKNDNGDVRLVQKPVVELETLRGAADSWSNETVTPSSGNLLAGLSGTAYEIVADLELPAQHAATEFGFTVRELGGQKTIVGYQQGAASLFVDRSEAGRNDFTELFRPEQAASLTPDENNRIQMRIFVDKSSVEVFGNDGEAVISSLIFPGAARDGMSFYAKDGNVKVVSLNVYPLSNIWRDEMAGGQSPAKVVMDLGKLELGVGQTHRLYASVRPYTANNKELLWSSSNTAVAAVSAADSRGASVTAVGEGRAVITAATQDGGIVGETVVTAGEFHTNLSGWKAASKGQWLTTSDGIAGMFDKDTHYMSADSARNFAYEADVKLDPAGGAASMLFRANADGSSGYYFNIDPNMKSLRLFYKDDGSFHDDQLLAKVPAFVMPGKTYNVKIVANGSSIKIYFDDSAEPVIDVNDVTFSRGYFGLNAFGGRAYYQNVFALIGEPKQEPVYKIVNPGSGKVLEADHASNGAHVKIRTDSGADSQKWYVEPNEDGSYTIRGAVSGKVLNASGSDDGSHVQILRNFGYDNQRWTMPANEDGTLAFVAANSGKALDIVNGGTEDGTAVQMWERNDFEAQKWTLVEIAPPAEGGDGIPGEGTGGDSGDTPSQGTSDNGKIIAHIDGIEVTFAVGKTEQTAGGALTKITVDANKLKQLLGKGSSHKLTIHVPEEGDVRLDGLSVPDLMLLSKKGSSLTVHTEYGIFPIQGSKDWNKTIKPFGDEAVLADIKVSASIVKASEQERKLAAATAAKGGYHLLVDPISVTLQLSFGGRTIDIVGNRSENGQICHAASRLGCR